MAALKEYRNFVSDNSRWEGFEFRDDDIVISTPAKCGTTWTQMLCALLIFRTPDPPAPLARLSPWLDLQTNDVKSVFSLLESQQHRRFIKTHTPLDGLPFDERVTYLCVARDPRDVALSWEGHLANMDIGVFLQARAAAVGLEDLADMPAPTPAPDDPRERFWVWADGAMDGTFGPSLEGILHQVAGFWERRELPNVALFHYGDLKADLVGQMQRLAAVLGMAMTQEEIANLSRAATFESMKASADRIIPDGGNGFFKDNSEFFKRGASGQWRDLLDDSDLERYEKRVASLVAPDVAAWVHRGWLGLEAGSPA